MIVKDVQMKTPIVSVVRNLNIKTAVETALSNIELPDLNGKQILLKPNVGREISNIAVNTNPEVVAAVFHFLKKKFQATFFIGDSPIISTDTRKAFSLSGYDPLLAEEDLTFLDLDDKPPITIPLPGGKMIQQIRVTGYIRDFDYIISIPVLKMHMHTGATLSFKNCKGLIFKRDKIKLHHLNQPEIIEELKTDCKKIKELDAAIADLSIGIQPDLAIIDATHVMEGLGPSSGTPKKLDIIIASTSFLAADIAALAIVQPEWTLDDVPHLKLISAQTTQKQLLNLKDIQTIPPNISEFVTPIEAPPSSITIKYKNVVVTDLESCSACLSTLSLFLSNNKDFIDENYTEENPLSLAIGRGIKESDLYTPTFLVGNCAAVRKNDGIFIKGCAPVQSTILKRIQEYLAEKETKKTSF
jgi:uncharacterized protein (DUF362 family)